MSPRSFGKTDVIACVIAVLLLAFLFIYPHCKLNALRDDISAMCDELISAADAEEWDKARATAARIDARFENDRTLLRFVIDHEDIDNASDAISSTILMSERCDGTGIADLPRQRAATATDAVIERRTAKQSHADAFS